MTTSASFLRTTGGSARVDADRADRAGNTSQGKNMMISKTLRTLAPRLAAMAIVTLPLFSASPAKADKTCGAFTVVLDTGAVFRGKQDLVIPASRLGQTAHVRGTFTQFDVDLTTFTVFNYALT